MKQKILLISNDPEIRAGFQQFLAGLYDQELLNNFDEVVLAVRDFKPDLVFVDNIYEQSDCSQIISNVRKLDGRLPVVFINQLNEIRSAVLAMKAGAVTVISKPIDRDQLLKVIGEVLKFQEERKIFLEIPQFFPWFLGCSVPVQELIHGLEKAAEFQRHPLLMGLPGHHFKEIARIIHQNSVYSHQKFIHYNFNDVLSEPEFIRVFENYLSEAAELRVTPATFCLEGVDLGNRQLKDFLRRLLVKSQEEQFKNFRFIICGRPDDLKRFKEGLAVEFRPVTIPSLADRRMDIPFLVSELVEIYNLMLSKKVEHVTAPVLDFFLNYSWTGQTIEMENVIKTAMILQPADQGNLTLTVLPLSLQMLFQKEAEKSLFQQVYNLNEATTSCWRETDRFLTEQRGPDNAFSRIFSEPIN